MRQSSVSLILIALLFLLMGCLTVESKEYRIRLNGTHSGEATIVFHDIQSEADDTVNVAADDFKQLIESYLHGDQFEKENPGFHNLKKRLYEKDGKLHGEVTFEFDSLAILRIFQYDSKSPLMYFVGSPMSSEVLQETNGTFGRTWMPVVFWPNDIRELFIRTRIISQASFHTSLVSLWRAREAAAPR